MHDKSNGRSCNPPQDNSKWMETRKRKSAQHSAETFPWRDNFKEKSGLNLAVSMEHGSMNLTPSKASPISPDKRLIKFIETDSDIGGGSHHVVKSKTFKKITITSSQNTIRGTVHAEHDPTREFEESERNSKIEFIKFGSKDYDICNFRCKQRVKTRSASKGQRSRSSISLTTKKKEFQLDLHNFYPSISGKKSENSPMITPKSASAIKRYGTFVDHNPNPEINYFSELD